jgi:hypothetical protein
MLLHRGVLLLPLLAVIASGSAEAQRTPISGVCGTANGTQMSSAPTSGLCSAGTASEVAGTGPWTWTCAGSNGGRSATCQAQVGSGIIPSASNASANWASAGMLSAGGIPNRTTLCATVNPLGNGADDTADIQNAVNACPVGQVVMLAAGTFTIAEGNFVLINKGITLRGAGPGVTIVQRTDGAQLGSDNPGSNPSPLILLGPQEYNNNQTATALTADVAGGAYSVQVASTSGFSVGQIVYLDEASGAGWQTDPEGYGQIWASPDFRVVWMKHNPAQGFDDFTADQYPYQAGTAGCWFSNCDRPTAEIKRISSISGNTITFDTPVTISYRTSHQAQLYYWATQPTENAGVENLTVSGGDDNNITFAWCAYCWAYKVENTLWLDDGFGINDSFRVQLEEVYVHKAVWPVPGGGGYAISLANGSSEILIENSISVQANKVMVARCSGAGSVVGYNYMDDGFISGAEEAGADAWQEIGLNGSHMVGSHHMLFEGNYGFNMDSDDTHGNSIYHTYFRNYATGYRRQFTDYLNNVDVDDINNLPGGNGPLRAAGAMAYTYWMTWVGNVLGTPGHTSGWVYQSGAQGTPGIWMLGWYDNSPYVTDPKVAATAFRDGNYDYLNNAVTWADGAHSLPNSLYLPQEPTFFTAGSGYTWPWVNPAGTPQLYTLPAKARYDAGTPFTQP